jgi:hypothetical protein
MTTQTHAVRSLPRGRVWIAGAVVLLAVMPMAVFAAGGLGRITLRLSMPVDSPLAIQTVLHALLGCAVAALQWAAGAGVALWFFRDRPPLGRVLLLGFPISLVLLVGWSYSILLIPGGALVGFAIVAACLSSFLWRRPSRDELSRVGPVVIALIPLSILFGCWLGFLAHGPTDTVPGRPSGDVTFYASTILALEQHPFPFVNFANEGEVQFPINKIHSLLGAALLAYLTIDPFLFVLATGGAMYVFSLGMALHTFLSLRSRIEPLSLTVLSLAAIAAARYPYWVVESPQVIYIIPLTVSIWQRLTEKSGPTGTIGNFAAAVVGSALSKVTAAATLAPLAAAPLLDQFVRLTTPMRAAASIILLLAAAYAAYMILQHGATFLGIGGIGPETYVWGPGLIQQSPWQALPYPLRDAGTVLLALLAFRMLPWPYALAVAFGLTTAFLLPFFMRINLLCAILLLGLVGIDRPDLLRRSRLLAIAALLMCTPAAVLAGPGGAFTAVVWLFCIGGMMWFVSAESLGSNLRAARLHAAAIAVGIVSLAGLLCVVAVARQQLAFALPQGQVSDPMMITPEARDIWRAVRQRTPFDALIFTDQTGPEVGALVGWNSFATTGQRQVYIAGWYQTAELQSSAAPRNLRLAQNEAVLSGQRLPTELSYRGGPYSSYFAVVDRARPMPPAWQKIHENAAYAIYRFGP